MQSLQAARPVQAAQLRGAPAGAVGVCQHPSRPARLRHLPESPEDACVELLVAQAPAGHACCILPPSNSGQARGLSGLTRLQGLNERTLADSLAAVEGFVATTCGACPEAADGSLAAAAAAPSPLAYSPPFLAYLERCLELAQRHPGLGPAVLLLQIVSRLGFGADPALAHGFYRSFYLPLKVTLEAAMELHGAAVTPQVAVAVFESWAAMGAVPMRSRAFGLAVRQHLRIAAFAPQELCRLLAAMAAIRRAEPSYRPCCYDVADACGALRACDLSQLATPHLTALAAALGALPWPVYQCTRPLLAAVAEEAVRRQCLAQPEGRTALDAALASARALSPSFSADLEAQVAVWRAQGRAAAGNSIVRAPPREAVPASASR